MESIWRFSQITRARYAGIDTFGPINEQEEEALYNSVHLTQQGKGEKRNNRKREYQESITEHIDSVVNGNYANGQSSSNRQRNVEEIKGKIPTLERGRQVAANVNDDQWILMTVLKYNKKNKSYHVEDADDMAVPKEEYEILREFIVPLPDRARLARAFASQTEVSRLTVFFV